jgi:hypothetical protein
VLAASISPSERFTQPAEMVRLDGNAHSSLPILLPARSQLVLLLLTSRSAFPRHPFRHKARSPQVRVMDFPAQPLDLRRLPLVARVCGYVSAHPGCQRLISTAHVLLHLERVLPVRRLAVLLPASFSADLAVGPVSRLLRLAGTLKVFCDQSP